MSNQDEIIRAMEYNIAEKQKIIDSLIKKETEIEILKTGIEKILEILTKTNVDDQSYEKSMDTASKYINKFKDY